MDAVVQNGDNEKQELAEMPDTGEPVVCQMLQRFLLRPASDTSQYHNIGWPRESHAVDKAKRHYAIGCLSIKTRGQKNFYRPR